MFKVTNLDENKTENTPYHQFLSVKTNRKKANTISNIIKIEIRIVILNIQ